MTLNSCSSSFSQPWQPFYCIVSMNLPISIPHISGIIQYLSFCELPISVSTSLRLTYVVTHGKISHCEGWGCDYVFISSGLSSTERHLGCLPILATVYSDQYLFGIQFSCLLELPYEPEAYFFYLLTSWRKLQISSIVALFYITTWCTKDPTVPQSCQYIIVISCSFG